MYPVIGVTVPPQTRYRPWWRSTMGATRARYWEKRSGIVDVDINQSIYGQGDRTQQVVRSQRFEPVLVNFLDGLIGPGGLVCGGSSSPWGWEWGVCPGESFGFFGGFVRRMRERMGSRVVLFLFLMTLFVPAGP